MNKTQTDKKQLRTWCTIALLFWTILMAGSLYLIGQNEWQHALLTGQEIGRFNLQKDYVYREWNASHGGVYVPISDTTPPNPHLSHIPKRDITTTTGNKLTLINPAYMTRQVFELESEMYGIRGHITSLKVIRPENKPDKWETDALHQFEQGAEEVAELQSINNFSYLRVMIPMQTREPCLKCHADLGYKVGDIRGGISVSIPMQHLIENVKKQILRYSLYHLVIFLIGTVGLFLFYRQTSRQLTHRAAAEDKLITQGKHLQGIVDNISNGIAVYDPCENGDNFIIKNINKEGLKIAQYNLDDVVGQKVTDKFPGIIEMGLFAVLQRVFKTGIPENFPVAAYNDDKVSLWLENYVYKLPTGEIVTVYNNVTKRKHTEEQLLKKTEEWERTFDAIPDIITLQDKNMNIIRANQTAFDFFEMQPQELLGMTCYSLFRGGLEPCPGCPGISSIADISKHSSTIEHKGLDKVFQVSSSPILGPYNEVQYVVYIAQDITDKKRLEEELFQAQKMEAIGTLAGGIAHDFNNILAAIIGYAEIARADLPDSSQTAEDIDQVITAGHRATELVKQILTFSRKGSEEKKPLRISLIVKEAVKMMRSSLPTTIDIQVKIEAENELILADPTSVHQIVVNLCTNALHAMNHEKGTINVILRHAALEATQIPDKPNLEAGPFVILTVNDTGKGMDKQTVARIFDPYFTTKKQGEGTGLGLAVIHGIVEGCHGFIEVESIPGTGTAFHIYFPVINENHNDDTEEKDLDPIPTGNEKILFVDDEPALTKIGKKMLTKQGYRVTTETSSQDGLKKFQADPDFFDLVITDQTMPGLTGQELALAMLKLRPDLPVILCTGYSSAITEEEVLASGIKRFATKPLRTRELAEIVRSVLD